LLKIFIKYLRRFLNHRNNLHAFKKIEKILRWISQIQIKYLELINMSLNAYKIDLSLKK